MCPLHPSYILLGCLATLNVHDVTRDGGMANGRDVDYQRIDPSMERNNSRIVAAAQQKRMCKKDEQTITSLVYDRTENNLFSCYVSTKDVIRFTPSEENQFSKRLGKHFVKFKSIMKIRGSNQTIVVSKLIKKAYGTLCMIFLHKLEGLKLYIKKL